MKKYSRVYPVKGEKHFGYRYNFEHCVLEYVNKWDFRKDESGNWGDVILEDWEVVSSVGLCSEDWKENPQYWVDLYASENSAEADHIAQTEFATSSTSDFGPSNPWDAPGMNTSDFVDFKVCV